MNSKLILFVSIFLLSISKTFAGWYEIYNFTGHIDKYPVTFSFQVKYGYFGEKDKKDYNLIGVYKYDKFNNPIRLEGKFDRENNQLEIYELDENEKITATFLLNLKSEKLTGTWKNSKNKFEVKLKLKDQLSDFENEEFQNIEIMQFNSLKDFYFVGVYSKFRESEDAHMDELKIINKKTNKLHQTLNFEAIESSTGNITTIIYDNVITDKTNDFMIYNDLGTIAYVLVAYNPEKNMFFVDPIPFIDGIDPDSE